MAKIISPQRLGMALDEALERHKSLTEKQINTAIKKTAIKIWGNIIKMTPVDTGRARNSWFVGMSVDDKEGRKGGNKGGGYVQKSLPEDVVTNKVYLYNNLPYIYVLEYGHSKHGHSKQAPKGMVRLSLLKWGSTLKKEFKKAAK